MTTITTNLKIESHLWPTSQVEKSVNRTRVIPRGPMCPLSHTRTYENFKNLSTSYDEDDRTTK